MRTMLLLAGFALLWMSGQVKGDDMIELDPAPGQERFGAMIPRTMKKLVASTSGDRQRVEILFYGQSITAQPWWREVVADLEERFPHALIEAENLAIGGAPAPSLVRTFYHDVPPVYPDLIFFHDYAADTPYFEEMVRGMRQLTTAEIVLSTHHRCVLGETEEAQRNVQKKNDAESEVIRELAVKYGCELVEVREEWDAYLEKEGLQPEEMLRDGIHLNERGEALMAALVKRHFRVVEGAANPLSDCIRDLPAEVDENGMYRCHFTGNRVDVIFGALPEGETPGSGRVLLDGRALKEFDELYVVTRPSEAPQVWWPGVRRVGREKPLVVEDWTLTVTEALDENKHFAFEVAGSKTGPDGNGTSRERFVSNSGRVVIEPQDWNMAFALSYKKQVLHAEHRTDLSGISRVYASPSASPVATNPSLSYSLAAGEPSLRHR